jgi:hypothetical protein
MTMLRLTWDDNSPDETGFQIERESPSGAGFALLATVAADVRTYDDMSVVPGTPYCYRVRAIGAASRESAWTSTVCATVPGGASGGWVAPLGIPAPPFGIVEMAGAVTHYVDNTHPAATDASNPNGSPALPRLTIPLTGVAAGSVVEVRGGPYSPGTTTYTLTAAGTPLAPIFYRGIRNGAGERPRIINRTGNVQSTYTIIEGFDCNNANASGQRAQFNFGGSDHCCLRDCELHEQIPDPGGGAVIIGGGDFIVVYNNHIHHNAWDPTLETEHDIHGVQVGAGSHNCWIVDNEFDHNGGDGVQVNATAGYDVSHVYIGRNVFHADTENGVDIKQCTDVIISQNVCHSYVPADFVLSGSDGTAIVINDDNVQNGLNNNIWVIFNRVHSSHNAIRTQAYAYIIGNVFHDLNPVGGAAWVSFGSHSAWFEHNTLYNCPNGIDRSGGANNFYIDVRNNILHHTDAAGFDLFVTSNAVTNSRIHNNVFPSAPRISWSSTVHTSVAAFETAQPTKADNNVQGDPAFVAPGSANFALQDGSVGINVGAEGGNPDNLYDLFEARYGIDIRKGFAGNAAPQGAAWDAGAYERA